jgi:hypothetical protein
MWIVRSVGGSDYQSHPMPRGAHFQSQRTNRPWSNPGRVAIYGWHRPDGNPIQPLNTVHGIRYADYSQGVRLVSDTAYVGGKATPLLTLLQDR